MIAVTVSVTAGGLQTHAARASSEPRRGAHLIGLINGEPGFFEGPAPLPPVEQQQRFSP
jgi:hypothetical protein